MALEKVKYFWISIDAVAIRKQHLSSSEESIWYRIHVLHPQTPNAGRSIVTNG